ncbi:MAG TPA: hypothetical protein VFI63_00475 [Solirubrobacterales bacterium]|nr:hypothetical protein [Solirubrobacterales bacterium]
MVTRLVAAVSLTIAGWGGSLLYALTPQNQCSGDCSPCLGPTDPFCSTTTLTDENNTGHFCVLCDKQTNNCRDAKSGETGKDDSCTVVTYGTRVVSCTTSGNACVGTTVTP